MLQNMTDNIKYIYIYYLLCSYPSYPFIIQH